MPQPSDFVIRWAEGRNAYYGSVYYGALHAVQNASSAREARQNLIDEAVRECSQVVLGVRVFPVGTSDYDWRARDVEKSLAYEIRGIACTDRLALRIIVKSIRHRFAKLAAMAQA